MERSISTKTARELFMRWVTLVEIEVFSYCNRRCWFCPNAKIDRISENNRMDEDTYLALLKSLAEIDYAGTITFSRYNEPLADRIILDRLRQASKALPLAKLHTNTNGDYLDRQYLEDLYDAGLRSLKVQFYLKNEEHYSDARMHEVANRTLSRLALPYHLKRERRSKWLEYVIDYRDMALVAYGRNFASNGTSRGGLVDIRMDAVRRSPCTQPSTSVYVDYTGDVVPCCNFRSDAPEHADYVLGRLGRDGDIYAILSSPNAASFRQSLLNWKVKDGLCRTCSFDRTRPWDLRYLRIRDDWRKLL